jgi:GNAT superfamily N-acetyltransferase
MAINPLTGGAPPPLVRHIGDGERNEVVAVAARAFWHDPLFDFFTRDLLHEHELLARLFGAYLKDLTGPYAEVWVGEHEGRPRALAGWLAPGGYPRSTVQELVRTLRALRVISRARQRILALRLLQEVDKRHPHEPHWYLSLLATDPSIQGRGMGTALLRPVLARCDEDGMPAYLETQKRDNVTWYARAGFAVAEVVEVAGAPPVWCLRREPV